MPKYPDITVELVGKDGNAFNILGICRRAMKRAHLPESEIEAFTQEATSGDYNHLLITCPPINVLRNISFNCLILSVLFNIKPLRTSYQ